MKAQRRTIQPKAVLVELATGKKTEFEKTRRFAFSGERSSGMALHRYRRRGAGRGRGAGGTGAAPGGGDASRAALGSDLLLYDLPAGNEMNVGNVSEFAFDKKGEWLAWMMDAQDKAGNGMELAI